MSAEIGDLQRRLANVIRVGKVTEVDRTAGRVKVQFQGVTTSWLPWMTSRAGTVRDWSPPAVGEQVCVISPSGEMGAGFVLPGGINSNSAGKPDNRNNVWCIHIPSDGSAEIHVGTTHIILEGDKADIVSGGKTLRISGGKMTFDGDIEVTGKITTTGDVKAGTISLQTHKHTGVSTGGSNTGNPTP